MLSLLISDPGYIFFFDNRESGWDTIYIKEVCIYDLTLIFGAGNEPSTVEEALAQLPALGAYNSYDAGSLVDTVVSAVKSVGVNIWDEVTETGYYNNSGAPVANSNYLRSKNAIVVSPSTDYCFSIQDISSFSSHMLSLFFYDASDNFISQISLYKENGKAQAVTSPSNARYLRFYMSDYYGTTYKHDIQICLNSYTDKTTYHPYKTDTLSLSTPVTLRSAGSVSEVLTLETGKKTRPIGTITYDGNNDEDWRVYGSGVLYIGNSSIKTVAAGVKNNLICDRLTNVERGNIFNGIDYSICTEGQIFMVYINSTVSDVASLRTWLENNPITINYELNSPLSDEQVCDPIIDNTIQTEGGGTIETIQTQTPVIDNCLDVGYLTV